MNVKILSNFVGCKVQTMFSSWKKDIYYNIYRRKMSKREKKERTPRKFVTKSQKEKNLFLTSQIKMSRQFRGKIKPTQRILALWRPYVTSEPPLLIASNRHRARLPPAARPTSPFSIYFNS